MADVRIESDGTPRGTKVFYGDTQLQVRSVQWSLEVGGIATAMVEFPIVELRSHGVKEVTFVGLDLVPTEILQIELEGRDDA